MIYTPEIEAQLVGAIKKDWPDELTLPAWAYGPDGRAVVLIDGLPIDLHRHLHNVLIRPLEFHERMHRMEGVSPHNVNPHLFIVVSDGKSPRTVCRHGHDYAGNEAPPNSRGYRCRKCLIASGRKPGALTNADKTHCPQGHEYTPKNTLIEGDGKRRCRICTRKRKREAMARKRKEQS